MDQSGVANRLHELEVRILLSLKDKRVQSLIDLARNTGLNEDAVRRALLWLESKRLIDVADSGLVQLINPTSTGRECATKGLPERRLLELIKNNPMSLNELSKRLTKDEFNVSLGLVKRQGLISLSNNQVKITSLGVESLKKDSPEQELLIKALKKPIDMEDLNQSIKNVVDNLKERGLITVDLNKIKSIKITTEGLEVSKQVKIKDLIRQLTPDIIQSKSWENKSFSSYDVLAPVPRTFPGRKHFLYQVMEMIKSFFTEMGFTEMRSNYVDSCFWNYDVMFFPQDHPDRSIMDTFYLKYPLTGKVPVDYASIIKKVQETGWISGSKGRRLKWDVNESKKLILRCHTTQTSFRYLAKKLKPPYKFFSVDRVFRNETVDYKHLPEFHQVEGFIVDEGLNFSNLLGCLKEFYNKMGVKQLRFKPTYNPYTEPSSEVFGYFPNLGKWIELGNSGVFRPEVLLPFGIKSPVIAWGLALERLAMFVYDIDDIRQCLGHTVDFNQIRSKELLVKVKK